MGFILDLEFGSKIKFKNPEDFGLSDYCYYATTIVCEPVFNGSEWVEANVIKVIQCDITRQKYVHSVDENDIIILDNGEEYKEHFYCIGEEVILSNDVRSFPREYAGQVAIIEGVDADYGMEYWVWCQGRKDIVYGNEIIMSTRLYKELNGEDYVPKKFTPRISCDRCGNLFYFDDSICEEDKCLCEECRKRLYITPYHRFAPKVEMKGNPDDDLYFGVEIEVDYGGEDSYYASAMMSRMNDVDEYENVTDRFCYCSHDGSLDSGFEIITNPASLEYHKDMRSRYEEAFKYLVKNGYRGHNTSTAGIHVHFSRKFYEENEEENISKLLYLVEKFWDEIIVFSRRDYNRCARFMKKTDDEGDVFVKRWNKTSSHDGHYYAVNITNENTIELRMFKSTLNIDTYMATLEFVDKLVRTAKEKTTLELQNITFDELLTENARSYYNSRIAVKSFEEI